MNNFDHNSDECFCYECGNNSLYNTFDMCDYCYDDNNLIYYCYLCNGYYNYNEINNICDIYINSSNIIKKYLKIWLLYKN